MLRLAVSKKVDHVVNKVVREDMRVSHLIVKIAVPKPKGYDSLLRDAEGSEMASVFRRGRTTTAWAFTRRRSITCGTH